MIFAVDATTGVMAYIPNPITDGNDEALDFQITVTDGSGNETPIDLVLKIQGKENNAPVMKAPEGDAYDVISVGKVIQNEDTDNPFEADVVTAVVRSIDETVSAETVVYTAVVEDDSDLTYSLSGADAEAFSVSNTSPTNGQVSLNGGLEFEAKSQYNFIITATDASGNESSQDVRLLVNNQSVEDNSASDQVVYLAATDFNPTGDEKVSYSLSSRQRCFGY